MKMSAEVRVASTHKYVKRRTNACMSVLPHVRSGGLTFRQIEQFCSHGIHKTYEIFESLGLFDDLFQLVIESTLRHRKRRHR